MWEQHQEVQRRDTIKQLEQMSAFNKFPVDLLKIIAETSLPVIKSKGKLLTSQEKAEKDRLVLMLSTRLPPELSRLWEKSLGKDATGSFKFRSNKKSSVSSRKVRSRKVRKSKVRKSKKVRSRKPKKSR